MYSASYLHKRLYEGVHHRLRTLAGGRWASLCRPTSIALLLTEQCTARCLHCDIWKNTAREENPDAAQWRQVVDDLRDWLGPVQVVFTGGEAPHSAITESPFFTQAPMLPPPPVFRAPVPSA